MNCLVWISCCWLLKRTLVITTNLTNPESASGMTNLELTLFPPTFFDFEIADGRWKWNYPHYTIFWKWTVNYWLETWHTDKVTYKLSKKEIKLCEYDVTFFYWSHHMSAFSARNLAFTCFVRLQIQVISVLFFLCFLAFCGFQCPFYANTFILTFITRNNLFITLITLNFSQKT